MGLIILGNLTVNEDCFPFANVLLDFLEYQENSTIALNFRRL